MAEVIFSFSRTTGTSHAAATDPTTLVRRERPRHSPWRRQVASSAHWPALFLGLMFAVAYDDNPNMPASNAIASRKEPATAI